MQPNEVVATERLVDAVWGEDPPGGAGQRAAAGGDPAARAARRRGELSGHGARRVPGRSSHPEHWTPTGSSPVTDAPAGCGTPSRMRLCGSWRRSLALWRGPAYGEFATGFAQAPSVRLAELRTAAAEDLVELLIRTGAATDAVAAARELVGDAPLRERPVELLMRALHACGRVADALEAYRAHRQLLADELGLDPPAGPA